MIVKDEASSIVGTIESVKGVVDRYTILDTGSTDGTRELIREAFRGTPGDIYEEPFIDFATTRNRAIELEGTQSVFVLMLSGDEYLRRGASLRRFCEERRDWDRWVVKAETSGAGTEEAYNVRVEYGSHDVYDSTRLHRTDARWFYVGVTHEYMTSSRGYIPAMRVAVKEEDQEDLAIPTIFHDLSTGDPQNLRARWSLDLSLLLQEWRLYPNHTRTAFYIGQSYECLQDWENAFEWYRTRWELKGWNEEAYVARYRMARVAHQMGRPWSEIQQIYLSAHAYMRQRVEPLYAMGHYYYYGATPRDHESAFIFLHRASMYPFPENLRLFIDKEVYDFKVPDLLGIVSYYTGDYEIGRNQVLRALRMRPDDMRLLKNLVYFNKRLGRDPTDVARKKIS